MTDGLFQPYKVSTWDTIPDVGQGRRRHWYGDYYGVLRSRPTPSRRQERPEGLGRPAQARVQGPGRARRRPDARPTRPSPASGPPALANGGSLDNVAARSRLLQAAQRRRQLRAGHRQRRDRRVAARRRSASQWTYNGLADKDTLAGNPPVEVAVPTTGRFGGMYVQAISKYAPHPNAAKLWMEHLYSDEGQLIWLKGYCNPIRYDDLVARERRAGRPGREAARLDRRGPADAGSDHGGHDRASRAGWPTTVGVTVQSPRCRPTAARPHRAVTDTACRESPRARHRRALGAAARLTWLGLVPFLVFATLFLLIPTLYLIVGSFHDRQGQVTLQNYAEADRSPAAQCLPRPASRSAS